jgi:hypothetical protein
LRSVTDRSLADASVSSVCVFGAAGAFKAVRDYLVLCTRCVSTMLLKKLQSNPTAPVASHAQHQPQRVSRPPGMAIYGHIYGLAMLSCCVIHAWHAHVIQRIHAPEESNIIPQCSATGPVDQEGPAQTSWCSKWAVHGKASRPACKASPSRTCRRKENTGQQRLLATVAH